MRADQLALRKVVWLAVVIVFLWLVAFLYIDAIRTSAAFHQGKHMATLMFSKADVTNYPILKWDETRGNLLIPGQAFSFLFNVGPIATPDFLEVTCADRSGSQPFATLRLRVENTLMSPPGFGDAGRLRPYERGMEFLVGGTGVFPTEKLVPGLRLFCHLKIPADKSGDNKGGLYIDDFQVEVATSASIKYLKEKRSDWANEGYADPLLKERIAIGLVICSSAFLGYFGYRFIKMSRAQLAPRVLEDQR